MRPWRFKILALCPEQKRDQNPKFTPLSETTSIPVCFIYEFPPPPGCRGDRDDYMETLTKQSLTTQATETTSIVQIEVISVLSKRWRSSQSPGSLAIIWVVFPYNRPANPGSLTTFCARWVGNFIFKGFLSVGIWALTLNFLLSDCSLCVNNVSDCDFFAQSREFTC